MRLYMVAQCYIHTERYSYMYVRVYVDVHGLCIYTCYTSVCVHALYTLRMHNIFTHVHTYI